MYVRASNRLSFPDIIQTDTVGAIEVSTIGPDGVIVRWPETCLFLENGDSVVVATYIDHAEALRNHRSIVAALRAVLTPSEED